jgi:hypothetical protein
MYGETVISCSEEEEGSQEGTSFQIIYFIFIIQTPFMLFKL